MKPSHISRSYDLLWLGLALLILLCVFFLLPLKPHDYWFYLRVGRETLQAGQVPATDTFSYPYAGRPIYYQPWLASVVFWLVYKAGGLTATFLLCGVLVALTYSLAWGLMRHAGAGPRLSTVLVVSIGLATSNNWSVRPQLFAFPLFAAVLWVLWKWNRGGREGMWLLPIAALLWANLHGSFVLLFVLGGLALLFGRGNRRNLALWLGLALLATLFNPRGLDVWRYPVDLLQSPSDRSFSAEWRPPANAGWQMNIFFAWLMLFIPLAAFSPRRFAGFEWIVFLAFGWLALSGLRYVIWFGILLSVFSASLLADWDLRTLDRPVETRMPALNVILGLVLLGLPLMLLPGLREIWWQDAPASYDLTSTPLAATRWLADHPETPDPLWNDYVFGGYFVFAMPERPTWIDSRFNAFPPEHWEEYISIARAAPGWEAHLDKYGIQTMVLSTARQPDLIESVLLAGHWCERYRDQDAVIFTRLLDGQACP